MPTNELLAEIAQLRQDLKDAVRLIEYGYATLLIVAAMHHRPPDEHLDEMKQWLDRESVKALKAALEAKP